MFTEGSRIEAAPLPFSRRGSHEHHRSGTHAVPLDDTSETGNSLGGHLEFGGAVYSPDTVVNDELDEPIDSHVYLVTRNTRWLVELDDYGCLTVSAVAPDSA